MTADVEQLEFQAEARQLLDLMVHSVYSQQGLLSARVDLERLGCT